MNTNLESIIPLLNKNLKIIQRSDYFNFSIDSLLISEFVNIQKNTKKILDLGTGNAAIPLFLSKKTSAKIYGIEIQEVSYKLALRNININNLDEQIYIIYDNMKNYLKYFNMGFFDIIVSNPPYIGEIDMKTLEKELSFEPQNALYGGKDGLFFYKKIISGSLDYLSANGVLAFEIGYNQMKIISNLLIENGFEILLQKKDFAGFDRIIIAKRR